MRLFGKLALACFAAALIAAPARAQGQGRGFGGMMGGGAMLLANKGVQTEIKATEEQTSKLNTLAEEIRGKQREAMQGFQDLSQEERREKMQTVQREMQESIGKGLAEILKPEQTKRFHQIQTQQGGAQAFATPRIAEALKLTDDQKSKIRDINQETMQAMGELRQQFQDDREGAMKKMAELRKSATDKAVEVLTADQKTTWKSLTGEPYEVKFEPRPNN
jgi:Spy/CpxP family protein refolding chaperone